MSKKKQDTSEEKLKVVEEHPKKLTVIEFEKLENQRLRRDLSAMEMRVLEERAKHVQSEKTMLELMIKNLELKRIELSESRKSVESRRSGFDKEYENLLESIRSRLGIEGHFGYDPDSLEVVQN